MKRRTKTRLPRVTLLSYSAKELQRFVEAAEKVAAASHELTHQVRELSELVQQLHEPPRRRKAAKPAPNGEEAPS